MESWDYIEIDVGDFVKDIERDILAWLDGKLTTSSNDLSQHTSLRQMSKCRQKRPFLDTKANCKIFRKQL